MGQAVIDPQRRAQADDLGLAQPDQRRVDPEGAATLDTRIKMRRSSHVRIIAETSKGELWSTSRFVYTSLNGCV